MFALIGALFGFLSSGLPSILDYFHSVKDNKHELDMMTMQIEFQKLQLGAELKEAAIGATLFCADKEFELVSMMMLTKQAKVKNFIFRGF